MWWRDKGCHGPRLSQAHGKPCLPLGNKLLTKTKLSLVCTIELRLLGCDSLVDTIELHLLGRNVLTERRLVQPNLLDNLMTSRNLRPQVHLPPLRRLQSRHH